MVYKLATGAFVAVGLFLLAAGVQRWLDQRSAARIADTFLTAVEHGDRETVLSLLLPATRARIEAAASREPSSHAKNGTSKNHTPKRSSSPHPTSQKLLNPQDNAPTGQDNAPTGNPGSQAALLTAVPGTTHRIHHVTIGGDEAIVELRIEKNGFVSKPVLHLARSKTSRWKVVSIENGQVDPLWKDLEKRRARVIEQRTATELQKALSKRPGVSVLRTQPDGPKDR